MKCNYGVVITGLIGSGKSSVCTLLEAQKYNIICADKIAHDALDKMASKITEIFGENICQNGKVNRKLLGDIVFKNKEAKAVLEGLLHPLIHQKIISLASKLEDKKKLYFVDIPLFFEVGGFSKYDFSAVLLVYAPKELCLERILKRDGLDVKLLEAKISAQMDIEEKRKKSNFVLENTGNLEDLSKNLNIILKQILEFQKGKNLDFSD